jgi:hypothetical protein
MTGKSCGLEQQIRELKVHFHGRTNPSYSLQNKSLKQDRKKNCVKIKTLLQIVNNVKSVFLHV